ncbi:MAG: hypothetical protein ACREQM_22385, partial [Candidatus Dormibacteraceae bacterium]
ALAAAALLWLGRPAIRHSLLWPGLCWALVTALLGWSVWWPVTLLALAVTGATQTWLLAVVAQRLFEAVGDRDRGPVMALYARCAIATNCVGPLQAGILATALDVPLTLTVDAALLVAVTLAVGIGFRSHRLSQSDRETSTAAR